jgi:alpha-tubulin suppressor-like RCC1 family protein
MIKTDGTLWCMGRASNGVLGNGTTTPNVSSPVKIGTLTDWASATTATAHALAIKTDGTLWAWGSSFRGRTGTNNSTSYSSPVQIGSLTDWAQVSSANNHSAAIKTDGTLWTWGDATDGRLGNGTTTPHISSPIKVGALTDWAQVSCGFNTTFAVKTDGTLWGWGEGNEGKFGNSTLNSYSSPVQVGGNSNWVKVSAGANFWAAVNTLGEIWGCGSNSNYVLGTGNGTGYSSPVLVIGGHTWYDVSSTFWRSMALGH